MRGSMKQVILLLVIISLSSGKLFSQWEKLNFPGNYAITILNTPKGILAANSTTVFRSTDNGAGWDSIFSVNEIGIEKIISAGNSILLTASRMLACNGDATPADCIFRSDDYGDSWTPVFSAIYGSPSISFCNSIVYAEPDNVLYSSSDTGKTWTKVIVSSTLNYGVGYIESDNSNIYGLSGLFNVILKSSDNGQTWDSLSTPFSKSIYQLFTLGSTFYVGSGQGFFISTSNGETWQNSSAGLPSSTNFESSYIYKDNIFAGISDTVYLYNINTNSWQIFNDGFTSNDIADFTSNNSYIFMASLNGLWRRPVSDIITGITKGGNKNTPYTFQIQNYPNPFNPSTIIEYQLPADGIVTIKVYNILGKEINTLANGFKNKGKYTISFNGTSLTSGIYICKIQAGNYSKSIKMILMK
jgi:photosystem II stability/assembly factor-like uncharacterized protein